MARSRGNCVLPQFRPQIAERWVRGQTIAGSGGRGKGYCLAKLDHHADLHILGATGAAPSDRSNKKSERETNTKLPKLTISFGFFMYLVRFWFVLCAFVNCFTCLVYSQHLYSNSPQFYATDRRNSIRPFIHVEQCLFLKETESCAKGFHFSDNCRDFLILAMLFLL